MRASLKLESIGDGLQWISREIESGGLTRAVAAASLLGRMHGRMKDYAMWPRKRPWVAQITGIDPRFNYTREFVRGTKDYLEASSTGNRGVYYWFTLEDGLYEIFEHVSWKNHRRYFARVHATEITEISEEELRACLNSSNPSARTCSPPPASELHGPSTPSLASTLASLAGRTVA